LRSVLTLITIYSAPIICIYNFQSTVDIVTVTINKQAKLRVNSSWKVYSEGEEKMTQGY